MNNRDLILASSMQIMCSRMICLEIEVEAGRCEPSLVDLGIVADRWHDGIEKLVRAIDDLQPDLDNEMPPQVLRGVIRRLVEKTWRWMRVGDLPSNVVYLHTRH